MSTQLKRLSPYAWEIPLDARRGMRVPGIVYADERLIEAVRGDGSLEQLAAAACLVAAPLSRVPAGLARRVARLRPLGVLNG